MSIQWHTLPASEVVRLLETDSSRGLTDAEVVRRKQAYGSNELTERQARSLLRLVWEQLTATMVVILLVAAVVSGVVGDVRDTLVIGAIVVLNTLLGVAQEYRAEKALAALTRLAVPAVTVRREGQPRRIAASALVPGDVVVLEAGDVVPADARVVESRTLRTLEAALTGESEPVDKDPTARMVPDTQLGDRSTMVYKGTQVAYGRALVVVTATGMHTELGRIAALMAAVGREETPLQRRLDKLGKILAAAALGLVAVIFAMGLLRGEPVQSMLLTAVSMAVAAVPEGLPAVVTIALALGAQRMLRQHALIRRLAAVESLGSVTVICSDKTGTLTENRLAVRALGLGSPDGTFGSPIHMEPTIATETAELPLAATTPSLALLLAGSALCNDATFDDRAVSGGQVQIAGDPTEGALAAASARLGLGKAALEHACPRIGEIPFDGGSKRMTTVHALDASGPEPSVASPLGSAFQTALVALGRPPYVAITKGAADELLHLSSAVWIVDHARPLTPLWRERIIACHDELAAQGLRVLGVAWRPLATRPEDTGTAALEHNLTFVGLVGLIDPARAEARAAVETCQAAGIRPVMITGDHPLTARAIARAVGIPDHGVLTGREIDALSPRALADCLAQVSIFARVSPDHKLAIVRALQEQGQIVAMTGDGVNDAPALKKADIGVAMGVTGTDVAKEAADMVLVDDNFATIVAAVAEGRVIYDNIRKFLHFLLSCNVGELIVMLAGPLLGLPLPLLPLQLLWVNLVTDGLPAVALAVEPAEHAVMGRPPRPPGESVFAQGLGWRIGWGGLVVALATLAVGSAAWWAGNPAWQTLMFTTLTLTQMAQVLTLRSEGELLAHIGLLSNRPLVGAVMLTVIMQLAVVYVPALQALFSTVPLAPSDLALSVTVSTLPFWVGESGKWWRGRRERSIVTPSGALPARRGERG